MVFKTRTLGDICDEVGGIIRTGPFGSQLHESDYKEYGVPVIMPKNIINGRVSLEEIAFISEEDAERLKQHKLHKGDIVYGRRGDIGRRALITNREDGWLCGTGCLRISIGKSVIEPSFLNYYLSQSEVIKWISNQAIGATMPNLNTSIIRSVPISYPPITVQRKIAVILSAYDDLIENNTRRIKILEEMAQMIYREWFVNFRFPGHEKVKMVDSKLGPIPEGWEVRPIGELLIYNIGGGWGEEEKNSQFPLAAYVIRGTDIPHARYMQINNCPLRFHKKSNLESRRLQAGDIVFEVSGGSKGQPVGRALFVSEQLLNVFGKDVICASFCKLIRCNIDIIYPELIYLHLIDIYNDGRINQYQVQSTGITNFKFGVFLENELIIVPDSLRQKLFIEIIQPVFDLIQNLGLRNANLRQTRDLLLPKLISGELDVSELDIDTRRLDA